MNVFLTSRFFLLLRKFGRFLGVNKLIRLYIDQGSYQDYFDQLMINRLQEKDIFWDVGSNQGEIIKKVKSIYGEKIYCLAFEAHPILSELLKELSFSNYKVINAALSNKVGEASFVYGSDPMQTTGRIEFDTFEKKNIKVQEIDLLYCLNILNLKTPNIIKIDVEGHEYEVLSSILTNIEQLNKLRAIFVEIHMSILEKRKLTIKMKQLLEKFKSEKKFKLKWIDISHFVLER